MATYEPSSDDPFSQDEVGRLLAAARAAPSIHNTQPWRFQVLADGIEVLADRRRGLPAVDPDGRQLLISCGAAVFNLRLAIAHLGYQPVTGARSDGSDPDHVATVRRGVPRPPERWERMLYALIARRRTDRGGYRPVPVPDPVRKRLRVAAEREGAVLHDVGAGAARTRLAGLVVRGMDSHADSPPIRLEFVRSLRDGVAPAAGMPLEAWLRAPYPVPAFGGRRRLADIESAAVGRLIRTSTLGVLCTAGDAPADWVLAGQALQRVLLTAAAAGIAVSFLNQPIEVPALRSELADLLGGGRAPQMLMRLGYAMSPAPRTSRRRLAAMVVDASR